MYFYYLTLILTLEHSVLAHPLPIPVSTPLPGYNGTLQITNHGNSRILCVVPAPWTSLVVFYLGNFVAHAATLVTYPGESPMSMIRGILGALFFPTSGITRGLDAIFRRATFTKTNLLAAARAGALIHVVRTARWRPRDERQSETETNDRPLSTPSADHSGRPSGSDCGRQTLLESNTCRDPSGFHMHIINGAWMKEMPRLWPYFSTTLETPRSHDQQHTERPGADLPWLRKLPEGIRRLLHDACSTDRRIHGTIDFSTLTQNREGYALEYVPRNAVVESLREPSTTTLARSYSLVKALVAIVQAIYAIATLVKAAETQVQSLGYAAFGLTAAPYAIMSLVNLIGNLCTPQYDALYLVETEVLVEAKSDGAMIDGQVGRLKASDETSVAEVIFETNKPVRKRPTIVEAITRRFTVINATGELEMNLHPGHQSTSAIPKHTSYTSVRRRIDTRSLYEVGDNRVMAFTSPCFQRVDSDKLPPTKIKDNDIKTPTLSELLTAMKNDYSSGRRILPDRWFFSRRNRSEIGVPWYSYLFFTAMSLLVGSISLLVIGLVSKFERNDSSHAQRVWIMTWIVFGVVVGVLMGFYNAVLEYRSYREEGLRTRTKLLFLVIGLVLFAPPAVGGFVVVGQMLREYGNCATLSY